MKITRLTVNNILRIRAAEITPDGALVMVAGRNDQGKSSILNSIALALSGKDMPAQPIRVGAATGQVILELDDLTITRKFSQTGGTTLEVRDKDGAKITSPQAKLDSLVSRVTFDPFEFTRMDPNKQLETVRKIAGIDFADLDAEAREKYDQRTTINRQVKTQEGRLSGIARTPGAPAEEVSVSKLAADLQAAQAKNRENETARAKLSDANDAVDSADDTVIEAAQALARAKTALDAAEQSAKVAKESRDALKLEIAALEDVPTDPIMQALADADQTNQQVRQNKLWAEEQRLLLSLQKQSADFTARLTEIEQAKQEALQKAALPVEGLGFSDTGVTFNGVPFEQASTSVKIRTSLAIARSLNPKLPVMMIHRGESLDNDAMALIAQESEKFGTQVWLEVVGDRDDATVIIEDGEVIATPAATKKKAAKIAAQ